MPSIRRPDRFRPGFPAGLAAVVGFLAFAGVGIAEDKDPEEPPFESVGEILFSLDLSTYRGSNAGHVDQEIYISVTNDQLVFEVADEDGSFAGELGLTFVLEDEGGNEVVGFETKLEPRAASRLDATDRGILQVIRESAQVPPGLYKMHAQLTDFRSQKVGLFNRMRKIKNKGTLVRWIRVEEPSVESLALSDLTFVRYIRAAEPGTSFGRNGVDFDPNPSRRYGLAMPRVKYYLEVYGNAGYEDDDSYLIHSQVVDASGVPIAERRNRAVPKGRSFVVTDDLDLARKVSAGRYRMDVTVMNERTKESVRTTRRFDVMWAVEFWGRDPEGIFQEMALIMTDAEYDVLEDLSPGAREVYLSEFWHKLDPTPDTAKNEILNAFRQRIARADREFDSTLRRGILTDRGRVYVRYGPPDDTQWEYSSSSFGGPDLVSSPADRAALSSRPSTSFLDAEEFRAGDVSGLAGQRGGATIKSKQLELWFYDGRGSGLRPDRQDFTATSHRGLKFIFADEMGNGDYRLISSEGATVY